MAAVIELTPLTAPSRVRPAPSLRLVQGGLSPEVLRRRRMYLRRRLLVLTVALAVLLVALRALTGPVGVVAAEPVAAFGHVVHAGDTMWSIAADVAPEVDRRVAVDRLVAANGGSANLRVGQVVRIPSSLVGG